MVLFTAVKPFPFTKADVTRKGVSAYFVTIITADGAETISATTFANAIRIANKVTK